MWDNRSTAHYANRDYGGARRVVHRITLRGDRPQGPVDAWRGTEVGSPGGVIG